MPHPVRRGVTPGLPTNAGSFKAAETPEANVSLLEVPDLPDFDLTEPDLAAREFVECPVCDSHGEIPTGVREDETNGMIMQPCWGCHGSGVMSTGEIADMDAHYAQYEDDAVFAGTVAEATSFYSSDEPPF